MLFNRNNKKKAEMIDNLADRIASSFSPTQDRPEGTDWIPEHATEPVRIEEEAENSFSLFDVPDVEETQEQTEGGIDDRQEP